MDIISIVKGDYEEIELEFYDANDVAVNLTGATIFFTVKENLDDLDSSAIIQKVVTSHTNPTLGQSKIILTNADTILPLVGKFYTCDIQLTDLSGHPHTPLVAKFIVTPEITKRVT
jgi:hypothetical protein